jgi:hypothetical protein
MPPTVLHRPDGPVAGDRGIAIDLTGACICDAQAPETSGPSAALAVRRQTLHYRLQDRGLTIRHDGGGQVLAVPETGNGQAPCMLIPRHGDKGTQDRDIKVALDLARNL